MTPHPDKLFQDRLEHYRKVAPASAWDRIESGLVRKRRRSPWLKIAAGLLMVIVTSAVIIQLNLTDSIVDTASKESGHVSSKQLAVSSQQSTVDSLKSLHSNTIVERSRNNHPDLLGEDPPVVERSRNEPRRDSLQWAVGSRQSSVSSPHLAAVGELQNKGELSRSNGGQSPVLSLQSTVGSLQSAESNLESSTNTQTSEQVETNKEQPVAQVTNEASHIDEPLDSKGTSITYSAEEVNAKYLKKESATEATTEKKNTSGFQKVIDLAMDFKSEVPVLGDLREKKNELLSFNMPSNKRELNK